MLKNLSINNIAVIEKSDIVFSKGFNALTGETGAGKSIIIDAINAVLGERTSKELIRHGTDNASVTAEFSELSTDFLQLLEGNGYIADEDGSVLIQRVLKADGRNTCKINGSATTLAVIKQLSRRLITIHGQHDTQILMDPSEHIKFIDIFAKNDDEINEYKRSFSELKAIRKELRRLEENKDNYIIKTDALKFKISELSSANIKSDEDQTLKKRRDVIRNSEKLKSALTAVTLLLSGDDEAEGTVSNLEQYSVQMQNCSLLLPDLKEVSERIMSCSVELKSIENELNEKLLDIEYNPKELEDIEERLELIYRLSNKYHCPAESLGEELAKAEKELEKYSYSDEKIDELNDKLDEITEKVVLKAEILTETRIKAAEKFSSAVCKVLSDLEMPSVKFSVSYEKVSYSSSGCDKMEFLISANIGEPEKPLSKVASGGELSRIMLAIRSVFAGIDGVSTIIFDEIDSGISGRAAEKVGVRIKKLSADIQTICITHLPQIAAKADNHLLIDKTTYNEKTYTSVTPINGDKRIEEIARLMSGGELTENLYNTAKELIEKSSVL